MNEKQRVVLEVNGETIELKPFIDTFFYESIRGMLKSLKGCENPKEVVIRFSVDEH